MKTREFLQEHYRHFNAASVADATEGWIRLLDEGGRMFLTLAGAMSTAELGRSLAELIRREKVHAICCTGANLEEDVFNLVAHDHYVRIPDWRNLTPEQEKELEGRGLNRVTDTCIPEDEAFRAVEHPLYELWARADREGERRFPHEYLYELLREGTLRDRYQIDHRNSWLIAAAEQDLPIFVPGWEDSTLGNVYVSHVLRGRLSGYGPVKSGLEAMAALADWYALNTMGKPIADLAEIEPPKGDQATDPNAHNRAIPTGQAAGKVGFFQIGGGIAGDFPICVVPLIHQDLRRPCPYWAYFCQIGDSTTSYGSYSGAFPTEKITWGKLDVDTPRFMIESDATIVAPLVFAGVLDW